MKRSKALDQACVSLHSSIQQNQRIKKLDRFREGKCNILICTDVASRGLDIPEVEVVISIHCPKDIDTLVHRSGRTARMGKKGTSIIIADGDDRKRLSRYMKDFGSNKVKNVSVPMKNLDPLRGDIEKLKTVEKADFKTSSQSRDMKWKEKVADEIGVEISDEEKEQAKEELNQKRRDVSEKKQKVKEHIQSKSAKSFSLVPTFKKRVFLGPKEMKELSDELQALKQSNSIRHESLDSRVVPIQLMDKKEQIKLKKRLPQRPQPQSQPDNSFRGHSKGKGNKNHKKTRKERSRSSKRFKRR